MARRVAKPQPRAPARDRIINSAARLFLLRGYHATSVDDVLAASDTGKSQLYHYFDDKDALVAAVVEYRLGWLRERQLPFEDQLDTWEGIEGWLRGWVKLLRDVGCTAMCPVGQLGAEAGLDDQRVRGAVDGVYDHWRGLLTRGLTALQEKGELSARAHPAALADLAICAVQGGTLIAKSGREVQALDRAVEQVLALFRTHATRARRRR